MEEINLKRLLEVTLSLKWIIIGLLILMAAIGSLYSFMYVVPEYKSSTNLVLAQVVQNVDESSASDAITSADITINNQLVSTYSEIITSKQVMKSVITNLGLDISEDDLSKRISVSLVKDTQVLKISAVSKDSLEAKNIAQEVANQAMNQIKTLYNMSNINILDEAEISEQPYNINHIKDIIIFEILGVFLSCGIVLIVYLIDTTIKDEKDAENGLGLPVLGQIPLYKESDGAQSDLLSFDDSKSPITECFRTLRTNLVFAKNNSNLKNILVISSFSSEGKSYVTANLAMSFAKTNKKVIIIDADMRKGRQHKVFNIKNSKGLSNCLASISKFDSTTVNQVAKYVKTTEYPNIHLITSGTRPANPLELVSSGKMVELISLLDKIYDYVIIDGTPTNIVSDSIALSKFVDATVLVGEYRKTKMEALLRVKKMIENVGGSITGIIINKCAITEKAYTEKYYYSEAGEEASSKKVEKNTEITSFKDLIEDVDFDNENDDNILDLSLANSTNLNTTEKNENGINDNFLNYKLDTIGNTLNDLKTMMNEINFSEKISSQDVEIYKLKKEIEKLNKKLNQIK